MDEDCRLLRLVFEARDDRTSLLVLAEGESLLYFLLQACLYLCFMPTRSTVCLYLHFITIEFYRLYLYLIRPSSSPTRDFASLLSDLDPSSPPPVLFLPLILLKLCLPLSVQSSQTLLLQLKLLFLPLLCQLQPFLYVEFT